MSLNQTPASNEAPNSMSSPDMLCTAARERIGELSEQLFNQIKVGDETKTEIATNILYMIKGDPQKARMEAMDAIGDAVSKTKRKYGPETSHLTGHYLLKAGESGHNIRTTKQASQDVSHIAELVGGIEYGVVQHNLANPDKTIAYDQTDSVETLQEFVSNHTVEALLKDYRASLKPSDNVNAGDTDNAADKVAAIARALRASDDSSDPAELDPIGDDAVGIAIVTQNDNGETRIHELLDLDQETHLTALKASKELSTSDVEDGQNYIADVLFAGSYVLPDIEPIETGKGKRNKTPGIFRQTFVDPSNNCMGVLSGHRPGEPSMIVSNAHLWPGLPTDQGLLLTQQRRKVDPYMDRFTRRDFTTFEAHREHGDHWSGKCLISPIDGGASLPLQINAFEGHAVDVWMPITDECKWGASTNLTRASLKTLDRIHLTPALAALDEDAPVDRSALVICENTLCLHRPGQDPVEINDGLDPETSNDLRVELYTSDLSQIIKGIAALETQGDISLEIDPSGIIRFRATTRLAEFSFFASLVLQGKEERSDRFYTSMRAINEQKQTAKMAA